MDAATTRDVDVNLVQHEGVRRLSLDVPWLKVLWREVPEVAGDDDLGAGLNGGGQHVAVLRVGQLQALDQRLVPGYKAVPDGLVHEPPEPVKLLGRDIGSVPPQRRGHLVEDRVS